jgi:hypothetical protein
MLTSKATTVLYIYLPRCFLRKTTEIRFSLHSDRAEGKSNPCLQTAAYRATPPRYQSRRYDRRGVVCIETSHLTMASFRDGQQEDDDWSSQHCDENKPVTCRQPSSSPGAGGGPNRHNVHKET